MQVLNDPTFNIIPSGMHRWLKSMRDHICCGGPILATIVSCKYRMYILVPRLSLHVRTKVTESWAGPGNKNITRICTVDLLTLRSYGQGQGIKFDFTAYCFSKPGYFQ